MDYWINADNVQMGPFTLEQLRLMWGQGTLTTNTYYYDHFRAEWFLIQTLLESTHNLFTPEEAFVRLGQNRQKGCLSVYNNEETLHLFVDGGFVVCAMSNKEQGEFVLSRALSLEASTYEWFHDARPPAANLRLNIPEYALKHSIARDIRIGSAVTRKHNTVTLPKVVADKPEVKLKFDYILVPNEYPTVSVRLAKLINVVGREDHCDVVIDDRQVSRRHCLLEVWEQNVKVKDLDSSNGTSVNGASVRDGFLNVGDQLSLGSYHLVLRKEPKRAPDLT